MASIQFLMSKLTTAVVSGVLMQIRFFLWLPLSLDYTKQPLSVYGFMSWQTTNFVNRNTKIVANKQYPLIIFSQRRTQSWTKVTVIASSCAFRSSAHQPVGIQRSVTSQGLTYRSSALTKFQSKLLEMEIGTLNEGLSRTQLTNDRLGVALSVLLTKEVWAVLVVRVCSR